MLPHHFRHCLQLANGVLYQWVSESHANMTDPPLYHDVIIMSWEQCLSASQVSTVTVEEVPCTILSMELFDRLQTAGKSYMGI